MAMMARMRSLAPAFILSVGVLFVLFMVISDSNVLEALGGRTNDVGSVNGEEISYQDFVEMVDQQREAQQNQTGRDIEEEELGQLRDQVWDAIVTQKLVEEEIEKIGLTVTDEEIRGMITGPNPPEFLIQNFKDSLGNFNRQQYESAIYDPQNKNALVQAENLVRNSILNEKLQSILLASVTISEAELKRKYTDQNVTMNVEYSLADLNLFPDSVISVSDDELKDYFNEHPDNYRIPAQRKLKYVMFTNRPSQEDSFTVKKILDNVVGDLKSDTSDFKFYVDIYSSEPYSKDTLTISAFLPMAAREIYKAGKADIVGPVPASDGYAVYNIVDILPSKDVYASASHILINQFGNDSANYAEAIKIYNQLAAGGDFEKIAKEKSADPGSAASGGDLGWFSRGAMVPEFDKAVFQGKVGEIQKPVKSSFGYHIIKVTGKSDKKYVVEKILNPVKQSAATVDETYKNADEFSYIANENGFQKEADLVDYTVQETPPFTKEAFSIPGIGQNKRIIDFAFENDLNDISEVFRLPSGYVVVQISEVINEGVKPLDEVEDLVKTNIIREKKYNKVKALLTEIRPKIKKISEIPSLNPKIIVDTTGTFNGAAGTVPSVGRDFAFVEKAQKLDLKKLSEPFKGGRGYYLINVLERTKFDSSDYNIKRNILRDQLLAEKRQMYISQWLTNLKKDADIVDNRHLFFGQ